MRGTGARDVVSIRGIRVTPMARAVTGMGGAMDAIAIAVAIMVIAIGAATAAGAMKPMSSEAAVNGAANAAVNGAVSARASGLQSAAATVTARSHRTRRAWRVQAPCRELLHYRSRVRSGPRAAHAAVADGGAGGEAVAVVVVWPARVPYQRMRPISPLPRALPPMSRIHRPRAMDGTTRPPCRPRCMSPRLNPGLRHRSQRRGNITRSRASQARSKTPRRSLTSSPPRSRRRAARRANPTSSGPRRRRKRMAAIGARRNEFFRRLTAHARCACSGSVPEW